MTMQLTDADIRQKAHHYISQETESKFRDHVQHLIDTKNTDELRERFYTELSFGTGGLRGIIGGGSNRINPLVVRQATQGLATYIKNNSTSTRQSVVIAYDSRNYSETFARNCACILCGNGIHTWIFSSLRPTPELSFAVRQLGADAGIVITASHNPPEYNGYKVYWSDGGQIVSPHDQGIIECVRNVTKLHDCSYDTAVAEGKLELIDERIDTPFIELIRSQRLSTSSESQKPDPIHIVFTPIHGTGSVHIPSLLTECGFRVTPVQNQMEPDGNFPTVKSPNPEEESAMQRALDTARECGADLVMGTDPDADRIAIATTDDQKEYTLLNGNQIAALLTDYLLSHRSSHAAMPAHGYVVKTIVTTELIRKISEEFDVECIDTLTGFKYIADIIRKKEESSPDDTFLFGCEESYGYLTETFTRDKNAVSAAVVIADMVDYFSSNGDTLHSRLQSLWKRHGYHKDVLVSRYFYGESGKQKMDSFMQDMRTNPPKIIGELEVSSVKDYHKRTHFSVQSPDDAVPLTLPESNVLQFMCNDGSIVTARPSGTEPKVKLYVSCCTAPTGHIKEAVAGVERKAASVIEYMDSIINRY